VGEVLVARLGVNHIPHAITIEIPGRISQVPSAFRFPTRVNRKTFTTAHLASGRELVLSDMIGLQHAASAIEQTTTRPNLGVWCPSFYSAQNPSVLKLR